MALHNIDSLSTSYLEVTNPVLGAALNVPSEFIPPGTANIYQCFIGSAVNKIVGASLTVGANATNPMALSVTGACKITGQTTIFGNVIITGGVTEIAGKSFRVTSTDANITSAKTNITSATSVDITSASVRIMGTKTTIGGGIINLTGATNITGVGNVAAAIIELRTTKKTFDIKHPNKPGYRLRHACVEGPEAAVYVRGKICNANVIELPDYWIGLIDPETITINLTQIGHSQDLIVEKIEWGKKIFIKSGNGTSVNCFYQVWADRLGEKLIVEYEGKNPDDYPGDNSEYSIAGWTYDKR